MPRYAVQLKNDKNLAQNTLHRNEVLLIVLYTKEKRKKRKTKKKTL